MTLEVIVMSAGAGTRMRSSLPKVLHQLAGKPLLQHVLDKAESLSPEKIHVIYGHGGEQVQATIKHPNINWVKQEELLGTGHAVAQALPHLNLKSNVLILSGDVPLLNLKTLQSMQESAEKAIHLLVAKVANPFGLGRIVRDECGDIEAIVEEKDASDEIKAIHEIYSGIMLAPASFFLEWLPKLENNNAQSEYYLTDLIKIARETGFPITSTTAQSEIEILGVNNRAQLNILERQYQRAMASALMLNGVTLADADRLDVRGKLSVGKDVFIDVNAIFEGEVSLGDNVSIGPNCVLNNVSIADGSQIKANSLLENAVVGESCTVGPFARLRPGTVLETGAKVGNFVEVKNSTIGLGSKASHLSYIGDASVGNAVNIGAGTITCNYDGVNKHKTIIEDEVHIGSDTQLVAPVTIGKGATTAAGATVRKNVAAGDLVLNDTKQKAISGWHRPVKKEDK